MAKFVKLESGNYINIDLIITIDKKFGETYCAHTLGFDAPWVAHSEDLTESDLNNVLKASEERWTTDGEGN